MQPNKASQYVSKLESLKSKFRAATTIAARPPPPTKPMVTPSTQSVATPVVLEKRKEIEPTTTALPTQKKAKPSLASGASLHESYGKTPSLLDGSTFDPFEGEYEDDSSDSDPFADLDDIIDHDAKPLVGSKVGRIDDASSIDTTQSDINFIFAAQNEREVPSDSEEDEYQFQDCTPYELDCIIAAEVRRTFESPSKALAIMDQANIEPIADEGEDISAEVDVGDDSDEITESTRDLIKIVLDRIDKGFSKISENDFNESRRRLGIKVIENQSEKSEERPPMDAIEGKQAIHHISGY